MPLDAGSRQRARPGEWRYAPFAVVLHWLLAALIVCMVGLGFYMVAIEDDPGAERWFGLHQTLGLVVFVLVLARAAWRLAHRPAALPASVPRWEAIASMVVQRLLYAGMILLPITGFLGSSYTRDGISWFGFVLPRWRAPDHATAEALFGVHVTIVWCMLALVALHALGGLKHALVDRDRVFQRMWF
ncbi:MAG: cytochrome b [Telluria sp.]